MRALFLVVACAGSVQAPARTASPPRAPQQLSAGSPLVVQLDRELVTGKTSPGDHFSARLVTRVPGIPADIRVEGTVVDARRGSDDSEPVLRLRVDRIGRCRLRAKITSAEMENVSRPPGEAFRGGAIIGAVVGAIMWRGPGMVTGFGVGMTGGAVHEMRNTQEDVWLAEGALLQLRLTEPLDLGSCPLPSQLRARRSTPSPRPM